MNEVEHYKLARKHMVESQLRPNKIYDDRIADAMATVPRELFVPKAFRLVAYVDEDIEIVPGRYLMEPMVFARLLQAASIESGDTVLDVGCASGYSTAVLAYLAGTVVALESDPDLAQSAMSLLAELEIDNAAVVEGDLAAGLADQGPFDTIFINGSVDEVPDALLDQIAEDGTLVTVVRDGTVGKATIFLREGSVIGRRVLFDAAVPLLPGFQAQRKFEF